MTFCVGIKTRFGLIGLADTQIVKGDERLSKGKLSWISHGEGFLWIMTSGLRSIRDKTITYTEEVVSRGPGQYRRLFEVANLFGQQLRRVREEDGEALREGNLQFNLNAVIGGRLKGDSDATMFYIYPEGNWLEVDKDSPYFVIGRTLYAKPILDRLLTMDTPLPRAAALAYLGFDATKASVTDVDFPIDMVAYDRASDRTYQHRYHVGELEHVATWWQNTLRSALAAFPLDWARPVLGLSAPPDSER